MDASVQNYHTGWRGLGFGVLGVSPPFPAMNSGVGKIPIKPNSMDAMARAPSSTWSISGMNSRMTI